VILSLLADRPAEAQEFGQFRCLAVYLSWSAERWKASPNADFLCGC
jgi:hypothetical protein